MDNNTLKKTIKKMLSKDFTVNVSKTGLNVVLHVELAKVFGIDNAEALVKKMVKELKQQYEVKLEFDASGSDLLYGTRDWEFVWEFVNAEAKKTMVAEAKDALNAMKKFFNKYGNAYCDSSKAYDVIEHMRALVETDEN